MDLPFLPYIPYLLQVFPFVLAFVLAFATPLRKYPVPFYLLWTAAVVINVTGVFGDTVPALFAIANVLSSPFIGISLYVIVMFIGALKKKVVVKRLLSIRTEMSVIGGIIIFGHVLTVLELLMLSVMPIWDIIWGPAATIMFAAIMPVGVALTLCFLIPWITSFRVVRKAMSYKTWKNIQKLAYPFMILMLLQGFLLALGHAIYGMPLEYMTFFQALASPITYTEPFIRRMLTALMYLALLVAYIVLRARKRTRDKKRQEAKLR